MSLLDDAYKAAGEADRAWWQLINDNHGSGRGVPGQSKMEVDAVLSALTADGPVILLPDTGDGVKVAKLDDIERLREHTTFIAEDGEVSIRRYRPDEWRYALIDAVRMVAE